MNEINQRSKIELICKCNCGGSHFALFDIYDWDDYAEFGVAMIDQPCDLWWRIKKGLRYVFKGGNLYHIDVCLILDDVKKLRDLCDHYIKKFDADKENK